MGIVRGMKSLTSVLYRAPQLKYARKNEEFELRRAFLKLDKNNDNKIDAEELAAFFGSLGHKVKKVQAFCGRMMSCRFAVYSEQLPGSRICAGSLSLQITCASRPLQQTASGDRSRRSRT